MVYVNLQDHAIKGSGDFREGNSSLYIPTLPKLIAIDILLMDVYNYFSLLRDITTPRDYMVI